MGYALLVQHVGTWAARIHIHSSCRFGLQGPYPAATGPLGACPCQAQGPAGARAARRSLRVAATGKCLASCAPRLRCPARLSSHPSASRWAGSAPAALSSTNPHGPGVRCAVVQGLKPTRYLPRTSLTRTSGRAWPVRRRRCASTSRWAHRAGDRHLQAA